MYGYIRPLKSEMKVREYELYKSVYCGLCHSLGKNFGFAARFSVSYDMTFLCMLLEGKKEFPELSRKFCPIHPVKKRCVACRMDGSVHSAAVTVLLFYGKLKDTVADEGFFKRTAARLCCLFFKPAYKKAKKMLPALAEIINSRLSDLSAMEKQGEKRIDRAADCFGQITRAAGLSFPGREEDTALGNLLYQVGRAVYVADAMQDLEEDAAAGRYNPVTACYGISDREALLSKKDSVYFPFEFSLSTAAQELLNLPKTPYTAILQNILLLGLPSAGQRALSGNVKNSKEF